MSVAFTEPPQSLLTAARAGCREALGRVFQDFRCYLLGIARQEIPPSLQGKGSASDLVQEAFLEAANCFEQFHGDSQSQLKAWLRQLLLRRIAKFDRRYLTTQKRRIGLEKPCELAGGRRPPEVPAAVPSPSALVMEAEQSQALRQVLERLPEDYRQVIRLRYEEERSFKEIGDLMQRTPNAARLLWLRAIERVKQDLKVAHAP
jgi:RNA polymerase sigma-70 factor (ECF subfamily)